MQPHLFSQRLRLFTARLCFGLLLGTPGFIHAAVVYSGLKNIPIPTTFDGEYLNLDDGSHSTSPITGWDVNFFFGGVGMANSDAFQPVRTSTNNMDAIVNLAPGTLIGASTPFFASGFGGSGDIGSEHLGAGIAQFQVGTAGYIGFRLIMDDLSGPFYGWMRVTFTANTTGALIHDWAWDDTGASILAGALTPEPSRAMLLMLGSLGLTMRRRRSIAQRARG